MNDGEVTSLSTLQFAWGGLFDARPADGGLVHLVRCTSTGTPGPTLCGINRFAKDGPGWSVGGGISGPDIPQVPCQGCVAHARAHYSDRPVSGLGGKVIAAEIGVAHYAHGAIPKKEKQGG